jgi:hypothetical protein
MHRPKQRLLLSAPTGSGKSYPQIEALKILRRSSPGYYMTTPSIEIIRGLLRKLGEPDTGAIVPRAMAFGIYTPRKLANAIARGDITDVKGIIIDEVHEFVETNSIPDFFFKICPLAPLVGYTATPFRGTPKQTKQLADDWPVREELLTLPVAQDRGWIHFPEIKPIPLVDDDLIIISNGKFSTESQDDNAFSRMDDLANLCEQYWDIENHAFQRGIFVTLPSKNAIAELLSRFAHKKIPAYGITADTPRKQRNEVLDLVAKKRAIGLQIKVLERGVDIPSIRVLIDAKPTLSPVAFLQLYGRVFRPHEEPNTIVCTNRNLERHSYLFGGLLPPGIIAKAAEGFDGFSNRFMVRQAGLEVLGKFKVLRAPLSHRRGTHPFYHLWQWEHCGASGNERAAHYLILVQPGTNELIVGRRYGRGASYSAWHRAELPTEFKGFQTSQHREDLTPGLRRWWHKGSRRVGLDRDAYDSVNVRVFQILPMLTQLKVRL